MMTPKSNLIKVKEVCSVCTKYILIGHSASVCGHCDIIFHTKCAKRLSSSEIIKSTDKELKLNTTTTMKICKVLLLFYPKIWKNQN